MFHVADFRVLTHIDGPSLYDPAFGRIYNFTNRDGQDLFCFRNSTGYGFIIFGKDFVRTSYGTTRCTYELKWRILDSKMIDYLIHNQDAPPELDLIRYDYIPNSWKRQMKWAQASAAPLPLDLQRLLFEKYL